MGRDLVAKMYILFGGGQGRLIRESCWHRSPSVTVLHDETSPVVVDGFAVGLVFLTPNLVLSLLLRVWKQLGRGGRPWVPEGCFLIDMARWAQGVGASDSFGGEKRITEAVGSLLLLLTSSCSGSFLAVLIPPSVS